MAEDQAASRDVLWKMFGEHMAHSRHYEAQRSTVINSLILVSAAILGLITFDSRIGSTDLPLSFLLVGLGFFGALFSLKHYERSMLHVERATQYRDALDTLLPDHPLRKARDNANAFHDKRFRLVKALRLYSFWVALNLLIAGLGLFLLTKIVVLA